jgi:hypothetical protein
MSADYTLYGCACLLKDGLLVLTVRTLYLIKFAPVLPNHTYHYFSLRQFELCDTVTLSQVRLSAGDTAVPDVDLLRRLIAAGHLGEFTHVAYFSPACLLAVDPVEAGCFAFLYLLNLMNLVIPAERAIGVEFRWHFHKIFTDKLDIEYQYYLQRLIFKTMLRSLKTAAFRSGSVTISPFERV